MKNKKLLYEITLWEFNRWFKVKDQLISVVVMALISLLIFGGKAFFDSQKNKTVRLAVVNSSLMPSDLELDNHFSIQPHDDADTLSLFKLLNEGELEGILILRNNGGAELHVNEEAEWISALKESFNNSLQSEKLKQMDLSKEQLAYLFAGYNLKVNNRSADQQKTGTGEKITAGVLITLMLMGIFISLAYQLVAITGEKQMRITELVVSAISPQTLIDGKILGISLLSFVTMITYMSGSVIFVIISAIFGSGWSIPILINNPSIVLLLLLIAVIGFFFWNIFFAAIAATINDPNTSARGSLMFIPMVPVVIAFLAIGNPNSAVMKFLSIFPLTSPAVLSTRLVLTQVSSLEVISAIVLLLVSMWILRIMAGKIFSTSIMMYGKEPEWKEIWRWLKQS